MVPGYCPDLFYGEGCVERSVKRRENLEFSNIGYLLVNMVGKEQENFQ